MKTEGTILLVLSMSGLLELFYVALGHLDELQKAEKYPIRWSL